MNTKKIKIFSIAVGFIFIVGLNVYQLMKMENMKEAIENSEDKISELEDEQIISKKQNKALSIELEEKESVHLESLERIESFEDKVNKQDKEIEKLEKDLLSKKEKEAEEKRLAKAKEDKVVKTASSGSVSTEGMNFEVTHYSAYDGTQSGTTRGGTNMANGNIHTSDGYRIVAGDPSVIPFGSIVEVTTSYGEKFMGKIDDTGGRIKGNIIDIAVASPEEAKRLGRVSAKVRVVK